MDLELTNKRVLITGSSKGIGLAIAEHFLREGASVVISSRGEEKLTAAKEQLSAQYDATKIHAFSCDFAITEAVAQLADKVESALNGIDIVVSNIGDGRSVPDALPESDQWDKVWSSNFDTALFSARAFLPMLEKSQGNLLFISSITAKEAFGAPVDYSTAKTAVTALAKNMARKLGGTVRVNVLAPGNVYFEGGSWDDKIKADESRVKNIIQSTVPMNRFGTPDEIADAALFICSNRAAFMTGSVVVVDGGQTVGIF